jgi:aminoglycoside/choline kinase family phosphotransferase
VSAAAELDALLAEELRRVVRACLGTEATRLERLGGGAAHRRFFRVELASGALRTCVARVDRGEPAPGVFPEPPLEPLRTFLEAHGIPVPRRLGGDDTGIDLLEDLGSLPLAGAAATAAPAARAALYEQVVDLVPRLQRLTDPSGRVPAFQRRLDSRLLETKARRFVAASLPAGLGRAPGAAEREAVSEAFAAVEEALADAPLRLAHRDLQGANVLVTGGRVVLIDLQGAFLAPPEYDLVCLLRDSYVVLSDAEVRRLAERVRPLLPDAPDPEVFWRRFDLLTLVRKAKDHALFHELAARGDPSWLRYAPPTQAYLRAAAARLAPADPRLARFAALLGGLRDGTAPEAGGPACGR